MDKKSKIVKNIKYYILFKGDTEEDCDREMNQIGIEHYQRKYTDKEKKIFHLVCVFTKLEGYYRMESAIMNDKVELLENIRIFNDNGRQFSIEEMFDRINKSDIIK